MSSELRPGAARGPYPERREPDPSRLDAAAARLRAALRGRGERGLAPFRAQVTRVLAEARALEARSDVELGTLARELQGRLRQQGLTEGLVARAFALVREVSGRTLGMRHYEAQLLGGAVMMAGKLAEMQTGEGKTLTATLPAAVGALAGIPVHVITVNDYLAVRDAKLMEPVYQALGLRVGTVTEELVDPEARRAAYACDVTYTTNKQLAFDYLRDRLVRGSARGRLPLQLERLHARQARIDRLILRGLCFAIVDEADSVLVDEARTPLILSRTVECEEEQRLYRQALELARGLEAGRDYRVDGRERSVELSDGGREALALAARARADELEAVWSGERRRRELVCQALSALHLYDRDKHYLVRDGKVQIVDPHTGRLMPDRSWERGLHQLIETKEDCEVTGRRETLARISYQQFFRRYLRLAGMTGTAEEVAGELAATYDLDVVRVPTHRPVQRVEARDLVYATEDEKWPAVLARIREVHASGRPVLVGTCSVASSERVSRMLDEASLEHQLLNARQDQQEAEIVARAGEAGRITVATNMAGRGTDIKLGPGVAELGGLHVIATERAEASRIDRQLRGRAGRQGDPGSTEAILSLEDELPALHYRAATRRLLGRLRAPGRALPCGLGERLVTRAQRAVERQYARMRRELRRLDERLGEALSFAGPTE